MKLSKLEQESIILYNEEEPTASIYTHDPKLIRKLKRLAEKYPDKVYPDKAVHAGAASYATPKSRPAARGGIPRAETLRQRPGAVQRRAAQSRQRTRQKRRIYAARKEYILRKRIRTARPHRKLSPCAGAAISGINSP